MSLYYKTPEIQTLFESEDLSEIDYLLRNGLDINSLNVYNKNAAFNASLEKMLFLEKRGINLFHKTNGLNILFDYEKKLSLKKFKYLIDKGLTIDNVEFYNGYSILNFLRIEQLEFLQKKCNFNIEILKKHRNPGSLFMNTDQKVAELIYKKYNFNPFLRDIDGYSSLYFNKRDTLEYLIDLGVDYTQKNNSGNTALFSASLDSFKYLVDLGLDPREKNNDNENLFCESEFETMKYMIEVLKLDPFDKKNGELSLYYSTLEGLDYLIKKGAIDSYSKRDLESLLLSNFFFCVDYLLSLDCYKKNKIPDNNDIYFYEHEDDKRFSRRMIDCFFENKKNINMINSNGSNLLIHHKDPFIREQLLDAGININYIGYQNTNVLFYGFDNKDKDEEILIYKKLLEKGVDIHIVNDIGRNCLFYIKNIEILKDLINRGVNTLQKDKNGKYFFEESLDKEKIALMSKDTDYRSMSVLSYMHNHFVLLKRKFSEEDCSLKELKKDLIKILSLSKKFKKLNVRLYNKEKKELMLSIIYILFSFNEYKNSNNNDYLIKNIIINFVELLNNHVQEEDYKDQLFYFLSNNCKEYRHIFFIDNILKNEDMKKEFISMYKIHPKILCLLVNELEQKLTLKDKVKIFNSNLGHLSKSNKTFGVVFNFYKNHKKEKQIIKKFIKELLENNLLDFMKEEDFIDNIKKISKFILKDNINFFNIIKMEEEKIIEAIKKRVSIYFKIKPEYSDSVLHFKNNKNENLLYFINSIEDYENCKKNLQINNISQYGENPLFYHIKKLSYMIDEMIHVNSFFEDIKKNKVALILKLIEDTEDIIEINNYGQCIYDFLKCNTSSKKEYEIFSLIISRLEKKKMNFKNLDNKGRRLVKKRI